MKVPVISTQYDLWSDAPKPDKTLLVFLPGRGTTGHDFERQRFIKLIGQPEAFDFTNQCALGLTGRFGPAVDAITVDLTFPYYEQKVATQRLHDDIIGPARVAGYRQIWLVGCSVGALGAIFYDDEHPGEISGIVALGPYLGEKEVAREIAAAGGLDRWQPNLAATQDHDFQRKLWVAIRRGHYGQPGHLPLVLGYGYYDRFATGQRLLARQLPGDRVFRTVGFHDWLTWRVLWKDILRSPMTPVPDRRKQPGRASI